MQTIVLPLRLVVLLHCDIFFSKSLVSHALTLQRDLVKIVALFVGRGKEFIQSCTGNCIAKVHSPLHYSIKPFYKVHGVSTLHPRLSNLGTI